VRQALDRPGIPRGGGKALNIDVIAAWALTALRTVALLQGNGSPSCSKGLLVCKPASSSCLPSPGLWMSAPRDDQLSLSKKQYKQQSAELTEALLEAQFELRQSGKRAGAAADP